MFTTNIVEFLNELIKECYDLTIKTPNVEDGTIELEAISFNKKIYLIRINENGMYNGETTEVVNKLKPVKDIENLNRRLQLMSPININVYTMIESKHLEDTIVLEYKVYKDKGDEEDFQEDTPIESGLETLEDSKEIMAIVRKHFKIV